MVEVVVGTLLRAASTLPTGVNRMSEFQRGVDFEKWRRDLLDSVEKTIPRAPAGQNDGPMGTFILVAGLAFIAWLFLSGALLP
jgi:hypothetical protein